MKILCVCCSGFLLILELRLDCVCMFRIHLNSFNFTVFIEEGLQKSKLKPGESASRGPVVSIACAMVDMFKSAGEEVMVDHVLDL